MKDIYINFIKEFIRILDNKFPKKNVKILDDNCILEIIKNNILPVNKNIIKAPGDGTCGFHSIIGYIRILKQCNIIISLEPLIGYLNESDKDKLNEFINIKSSNTTNSKLIFNYKPGFLLRNALSEWFKINIETKINSFLTNRQYDKISELFNLYKIPYIDKIRDFNRRIRQDFVEKYNLHIKYPQKDNKTQLKIYIINNKLFINTILIPEKLNKLYVEFYYKEYIKLITDIIKSYKRFINEEWLDDKILNLFLNITKNNIIIWNNTDNIWNKLKNETINYKTNNTIFLYYSRNNHYDVLFLPSLIT